MIELRNLSKDQPYRAFVELYEGALMKNQPSVEAVVISSFNNKTNEVDARFVNLKYIIDDRWIFFSNYSSPKSKSFESHNQISAIFYWNKINTQIRIKAKISKTTADFSDEHFNNRSEEKNALAISSFQSETIENFEMVKERYQSVIKNKEILLSRPSYWGGFSFIPYYFEFWEGGEFRLNKRNVYEKKRAGWDHFILQP